MNVDSETRWIAILGLVQAGAIGLGYFATHLGYVGAYPASWLGFVRSYGLLFALIPVVWAVAAPLCLHRFQERRWEVAIVAGSIALTALLVVGAALCAFHAVGTLFHWGADL